MKLVCLDGYVLNPGDMSWKPLESICSCTIHDRTPPDLVVERSAGADILLTNKTVLSKEIIGVLPDLKLICVLATGYNVVDTKAAREHGIPVTNIPAYSTDSVAQMVFAHLLNLVLQVGHHSRTVREGRWSASIDFSYRDFPLIELTGLTMGIIGMGRIGQATAKLALAFGMKVIAVNESGKPSPLPGVRMVDLDDVFRDSDVVTLHCPLTPKTEKLINAHRLSCMKKTGFLINTGRGPLVDEAALANALNNGAIAGAGLDVLSTEPPHADNPLLAAKNCYITPHIAWATTAARRRLLDIVTGNVRAFIAGTPQNVVN